MRGLWLCLSGSHIRNKESKTKPKQNNRTLGVPVKVNATRSAGYLRSKFSTAHTVRVLKCSSAEYILVTATASRRQVSRIRSKSIKGCLQSTVYTRTHLSSRHDTRISMKPQRIESSRVESLLFIASFNNLLLELELVNDRCAPVQSCNRSMT